MPSDTPLYDPVAALDQYNYTREASRIRRFLWFCAGADSQLLDRCPLSERIKEEGIGGVVLATSVLAFFSGFYAFYTVFRPKIGTSLSAVQESLHVPTIAMALVFASVWSLIIFNLDRFVVSSTGHGDGTENVTWGEVGQALPRILMAIVISFTLSKPLEIRIMESELNAEVALAQQQFISEGQQKIDARHKDDLDRLGHAVEESKAKLRDLEDKADAAHKLVVDQRRRLDDEAQGSGPDARRGVGPVVQALQQTLQARISDESEQVSRRDSLAPAIKTDIAQAQKALQSELDKVSAEKADIQTQSFNQDGLIHRIELAEKRSPEASLALTLLLMVIEITPIFFKMMVRIGPYEHLKENQRRMVLARCGIEELVNIDPAHGGVETLGGRYHEADVIAEHHQGELAVERDLARTARETFRTLASSDMQAHPDQYLLGLRDGMAGAAAAERVAPAAATSSSAASAAVSPLSANDAASAPSARQETPAADSH